MASQKVFFSHNGKKFAPADLKHSTCFTQELYPAVTVHGLGESVTINFGQEPFKFDLRNFEEEEIRRVRAKIVEIQVSDSLVQQVRMKINNILVHCRCCIVVEGSSGDRLCRGGWFHGCKWFKWFALLCIKKKTQA